MLKCGQVALKSILIYIDIVFLKASDAISGFYS